MNKEQMMEEEEKQRRGRRGGEKRRITKNRGRRGRGGREEAQAQETALRGLSVPCLPTHFAASATIVEAQWPSTFLAPCGLLGNNLPNTCLTADEPQRILWLFSARVCPEIAVCGPQVSYPRHLQLASLNLPLASLNLSYSLRSSPLETVLC